MRHLFIAVAMLLGALLITATLGGVLQSRAVAHNNDEAQYTPPSLPQSAPANRPATRETTAGGAASGSTLSGPQRPRQRALPRQANEELEDERA